MTKMSRVLQGVVLTFALVAPSADALGVRRMDTTGSSAPASVDTVPAGPMATATSVGQSIVELDVSDAPVVIPQVDQISREQVRAMLKRVAEAGETRER